MASIAYMHAISDENKGVKGIQTVTVNDIIGELTKDYTIKRIPSGTVSLRNPETDGNIEVFLGDGAKEVSVTPHDGVFTNYVELKGKYYPFNLENGKVTVGEGQEEEPVGGEPLTLTATSSDESKVTVSTIQEHFTVAITPVVETTEPVTITITYGESTTLKVTVSSKYTLNVGSSDANMGTVSVTSNLDAIGTNEYRKGTQITLTATPKAGTEYVFKGWYEGTETTDSTKLIEGAESTYQFTLNESKTLTAKFGEDTIDNSGSLVEGFVDDLGTRATIYLYGNSPKVSSGTITITMPDNTTKNITALSSNTSIGSTNNYATYTVSKNGTYTFSATNGTTTTETKIRVKNIETFTSIEDLAGSQGLNYYNNEKKAYKFKNIPVPEGYYVDEDSELNTGIVITDDIDNDGYSIGNEWVWVPVNSSARNNDFYVNSPGTLYKMSSVSYKYYGKLWSYNSLRNRGDYGYVYEPKTDGSRRIY